MASKTSSSEASMVAWGTSSPFRILSASEGLPPTAVCPPRLNVGDIGDLIPLEDWDENRFDRSELSDNAAFPTSHS